MAGDTAVASGQAHSPSVAGTPTPTSSHPAPAALLAAKPVPGRIAIAPKAAAAGMEDVPMPQYSPIATNGVTQKDWVIPPRPKPGRKPATDTPPSKRKAQNRAAQRAFRERRAARLTELEDQLKKNDDVKETALMDQVSQITVENNVLRATVAELRRDIQALQKRDNDRDKREKDRGRDRSSSFGFSSRAASPAFTSTFGSIVSQIASPAPSPRSEIVPCFEEGFGRKCCGGSACRNNIETVSTLSPVPLSRRESTNLEMEIDFTNMFSSPRRQPPSSTNHNNHGSIASMSTASHHHSNNSLSVSVSPAAMSPSLDGMSTTTGGAMEDMCGFCSEGTACVCAEMASMEKETERLRQQNIAREAFMRLSRTLPEPSSNKRKTPGGGSGCTGEPGSCAQCQSDPMSTLFCRTLATKKSSSSSPAPSGRPAKKAAGFVCCGGTACGQNKSSKTEREIESVYDTPASKGAVPLRRGGSSANNDKNKANKANNGSGAGDSSGGSNNEAEASRGTYIPCSDAYLSLSRHKRFMDADLGTVVKKLNTSGLGVEVSSVKQVLEYLEALESFQNNESRRGSVDGGL